MFRNALVDGKDLGIRHFGQIRNNRLGNAVDAEIGAAGLDGGDVLVADFHLRSSTLSSRNRRKSLGGQVVTPGSRTSASSDARTVKTCPSR
jgi:hypothetical protein